MIEVNPKPLWGKTSFINEQIQIHDSVMDMAKAMYLLNPFESIKKELTFRYPQGTTKILGVSKETRIQRAKEFIQSGYNKLKEIM